MPKDDKRPPAFTLYVNDFCADGIVEAMTTEEVGAYFLILCKAWLEEPCGTVPNDDTILSRWSRLSSKRWAKARERVLAAFKMGEDGRWHQTRMEKEYMKWLMHLKEKSDRGKKGADARWGDAQALPKHDPSNACAMLKNANSTSNSTSNSNSLSISKEVVVVGAINSSISENARAKLDRLKGLVPDPAPRALSVLAKVAVLWDDGAICEDAIEQVIESFSTGKRISDRPAWFYRCMANQCEQRGQNFEQLLASTAVPLSLLTANGSEVK